MIVQVLPCSTCARFHYIMHSAVNANMGCPPVVDFFDKTADRCEPDEINLRRSEGGCM